jgi:hypothetical protein
MLPTTREMLAAAALQGILAGRNHLAKPYTPDEAAEWAVKCADATIVQLKRQEIP